MGMLTFWTINNPSYTEEADDGAQRVIGVADC